MVVLVVLVVMIVVVMVRDGGGGDGGNGSREDGWFIKHSVNKEDDIMVAMGVASMIMRAIATMTSLPFTSLKYRQVSSLSSSPAPTSNCARNQSLHFLKITIKIVNYISSQEHKFRDVSFPVPLRNSAPHTHTQ